MSQSPPTDPTASNDIPATTPVTTTDAEKQRLEDALAGLKGDYRTGYREGFDEEIAKLPMYKKTT